MTEENSELIKALETLTKTLGVNTNQTKDNSKLLKKAQEDSKKLGENFKKLNDTIDRLIRKTSGNTSNSSTTQPTNTSSNQANNQLSQSVASLTSTFNTLNRSAQQFQRTLSSASIQQRKFSNQPGLSPNRSINRPEQSKDKEREPSQILSKLMEYTNAIKNSAGRGGKIGDYSDVSSRVFNDSGKGIIGTIGSITKFGGLIGKLLTPLGAVVSILGMFVARTVAFAQKSLDALDQISKFGGHIGITSDEVIKLSHAAGYTSSTVDKWADHLAKNSQTLLLMGMPMSDAVRSFSELSDVGEDLRKQFARLGHAFDDQAEVYLQYVDSVVSRGLALSKDENIRKKEMKEFVVVQSAINDMLGVTAEQMKQERDKLNVDVEFQSLVARLGPEEGAKIQKNMELLANINPAFATAAKEQLTRGTYETEESQGLLRSGVDVVKFAEIVRTGSFNDLVEASRKIATETVEKTSKMFGSMENGKSPGATAENLKAFGITPEIFEFLRKTKDKDELAKFTDRVTKKAEDDKKDPLKETQLLIQSTQIKVSQSLDNLSNTLLDKVVPTVFNLGKVIAKWVDKFTLFGPKMSDLFLTDQEKKEKGIKETQENNVELAHLNKLLETNTKGAQHEAIKKQRDDLMSKMGLKGKENNQNEIYRESRQGNPPMSGQSGNSGATSKIAGAESGGNPNVMYGDRVKDGKIVSSLGLSTAEEATGKKLSEMTLAEVQEFQKSRPKNTGAAGKYQFMPDTLSGLIKKMNLDPSQKFDEAMQDRLQQQFNSDNIEYLKKNGVPINSATEYLAHFLGQAGAVNFFKAKERSPQSPSNQFDFLKKPINANKGIFGETGEKTLQEVYDTLSKKVGAKTGGVFKGPESGYPVILHGHEAVVPLSKNPASKQSLPSFLEATQNQKTSNVSNETSMTSYHNAFGIMISKIDQIVKELETSTRVLEKILKTQPG